MTAKIHWCADRVYCWKCGKLTPLIDSEWGFKPCKNCGANLLGWYLRKFSLTREAGGPGSTGNAPKAPETAQGGILPQKKAKEAIVKGEMNGSG
jgi:hypothetical protein